MDAMLYAIQDRKRNVPADFSVPEHFTPGEGQPAEAHIVIEEPGWSPYCLDDANRRVLFVNTPPEVDLAKAPFYYSAQFEHAQRLLTMPYDSLEQVTRDLPSPQTLISI